MKVWLESVYWSCCEERFCWDESIAAYKDESSQERGDSWERNNCYCNPACEPDVPVTKVITDQPRGKLVELPILAPNILQVFGKSMIFKDDPDIRNNNNNEYEDQTSPRPNGYYSGNIGKAVSFTDGGTKEPQPETPPGAFKMSDFEIMFQDELFPEHKIFKIDEEEENESNGSQATFTPEDVGITMKPLGETFTPAIHSPGNLSLSSLNDNKVESSPHVVRKFLPRNESSKSILSTKESHVRHLPRAKSALYLSRNDSVKSFTKAHSRQELMKREDSLKNVLARLPQRSVSFLSIPDLIPKTEDEEERAKSADIFKESLERNSEYPQISQMPDTPVIIGAKLPKFFAETPDVGAYKVETSLQSIVKTPDVIFVESDYSMPRYYRKGKSIANMKQDKPGMVTSRSMPDLFDAGSSSGTSSGKVSKRLVKLRSKIKPLVIKKPSEHDAKNSNDL